ncbi:hypothetical protein C2S52_020531 [Perilla frutescens var. hirtella]|uniref:Nodulin-related protein 1 n=1 Tax=Perilla frutescens var. hirtella TaxID=608512 RepID=A0AAD4IWI9_PERFH|nr:hypothetical protein C2S52_020531 [Perilla frutescens var. hirtella]KAH6822441.1 hypothetical protein C2S53_007768 [Perilla frutescens var. hirtella]
MDFFSKNDDGQAQKTADGDQAKITPDSTSATEAHHKPSKSDLLHSAKVVADAAQAHFRSEPEKFDKGEVAGAAADLLDAAAEYGKLDGTQGIGMYVDKAEDYLRQYKGSHPDASTVAAAAKPEAHDSGASGQGDADKKADGGGGAGDLIKMAGDFLKK